MIVKEKSIYQELVTLPIPDYIKIEANVIWNTIKSEEIHRNKPRKEMLFFCIVEAYKNKNELVDPREIAKYFNLTNNEIKGIDAKFATTEKYKKIPIISEPNDFFVDYGIKLGINDEISAQILLTYQRICEKKQWNFINAYPQNITIGVIHYYFTIHGIKINTVLFESTSGNLKIGTIKNIAKQLATIDNS